MIPQIQRRVLRLGRSPRFEQAVTVLEPLIWLSLSEASGSIARNRAFTTYSPQSPGPELLDNPTFASWTDDDPDDWTVVNESGSDPEVSQRASGELHGDTPGGTGSANFYSSASANNPKLENVAMALGKTYRAAVDLSAQANGTVHVYEDAGGTFFTTSAVGQHEGALICSQGNNLRIRPGAAPSDFTLDSTSLKQIGDFDAALAGGVSLNQSGLRGGSQAVALDGSTGLATVYNQAAIQGMSAFTLSQLIKPDSLSDGDYLWFKNNEIEVWLNSDGSIFARAHYDSTDAETTSAAGVISTGTWAFVHVVLDDSDDTLYVYVNDSLVNDSVQAGAGSRIANSNNLLLWKNASSSGFDGLCDEVLLRDVVTDAAALAPLAHTLGLA